MKKLLSISIVLVFMLFFKSITYSQNHQVRTYNGSYKDGTAKYSYYEDANGNIIGFIDNSFIVTLPLSNFEVSKNNTTTLHLRMNINNWFTNPNTFDFNVYGGSIMQNQAAQEVLKENGHNVFSVE